MSLRLSPAVLPGEAGRPCWDRGQVSLALSRIAQLDGSRTHYFLASHTPIRGLRNDLTREEWGEEDLFRAVVDPAHGEVLALVHGEPGTGKSHLIHWLYLRLRNALDEGEEEKILPVLIQRRSGSLRDALEQLLEQLPPKYHRHLSRIREAVGRVSVETARQQLAGELRLELTTRGAERGRPPLQGYLRDLAETLASEGFREWLCRDGGPIDANIRRLTEASDPEDREALPGFTARDFRLEDLRYVRNNIPSVRDLIDDLEDEPDLREEAARHFNAVLPDAVRALTGLTRGTLREVFDRIRSELHAEGWELGVFVEDVSVMSALDRDVLHVFEPQGRSELCRTIAVLGLTEAGMNNLRDNQDQRATHLVTVGGTRAGDWREDPAEVARFVARYLNTLRLPDQAVRALYAERRAGRDVTASACDGCPVRDRCHTVFGQVEVDGVRIGTFPFTPAAPERLLASLDTRARAVRRNARGLLMQVVKPVVSNHRELEEGRFPALHLAVEARSIPFWAGLEERFLGGWKPEDRERLRLLAQFWAAGETAEAMAAELEPLRGALGLPPFTSAPAVGSPAGSPPGPGAGTRGQMGTGGGGRTVTGSGSGASAGRDPRLDLLLRDLDTWLSGGELRSPNDARKMLAELVREGIRWEDERRVPVQVWKDQLEGYEWVGIEGMRLKQKTGRFSLSFPRSRETRDLIEALAQFAWTGARSWSFAHAELHKRRVSGWLRRNGPGLVEQLASPEGLDSSAPLRAAAQSLAVLWAAANRGNLPPGVSERVGLVLAPVAERAPAALSDPLAGWLGRLGENHERLQEFLMRELSVPQGRTGGINFIDPLPILRALTALEEASEIEDLDEAFHEGFRASRYATLKRVSPPGPLERLARVERAAVEEQVDAIARQIGEWGFDGGDTAAMLREFCEDLAMVLAAQARVEVFPGGAPVPRLGGQTNAGEAGQRWGRAVSQASGLAGEAGGLAVLVFDPAPLREAVEGLAAMTRYLGVVERVVHEELADIRHVGDPDEVLAEVLETLGRIASAGQTNPVEVA